MTEYNVPVNIEDLVRNFLTINVRPDIRENYKNQIKDIIGYCQLALNNERKILSKQYDEFYRKNQNTKAAQHC